MLLAATVSATGHCVFASILISRGSPPARDGEDCSAAYRPCMRGRRDEVVGGVGLGSAAPQIREPRLRIDDFSMSANPYSCGSVVRK